MFERLRELISIFLTSLVFMLAGVAPATGSLSTCERSSLKSGTFNGANHFPLVVTEADGTVTTKHVDLLVENSAPVIHSYDANGNLESVAPQAAPTSPTRTYQWDAANRLVGITRILSATEVRKTEFLYNGMGARVGKKELLNGSVESDIRYFYGGTGVLQERTADGGTVTKTYTPQGEQSYLTINNQPSTINLYHTRDHLGSVREVVAEDGTLVSRYDYKPYGERVLVSGTYESSKGYTGHDYHADSGLVLTRYRAYDPSIGRWLSADPIGEEGGVNLYGYLGGNPLNAIDPLGLAKCKITTSSGLGFEAENPNPRAIRIFLGLMGPGDMIREFTIDGHGYNQGINVNDQTGQGIELEIGISSSGAAIAIPTWNDTGGKISDQLSGHIDKDSKFRFDGCNTANDRPGFLGSANNLAKAFSAAFPDAEVTGLRGPGWISNPVTGNANHVGGITRTYHGGYPR